MDARNGYTRQASGILGQFLKSSGLEKGLAEKAVLQKWPEIIGEGLVSFVELIDVEDGVLLLRAKNAAWKTEIHLQKKIIIAKANKVMKTTQFIDLRLL